MKQKEFFSEKRSRTGFIAAIWILAGVTLGLVVAVTVAVRRERETRALLMYQYDRALTDMSDAVSLSQEYLLKALATGSAQKTAEMLQEAARASAYAEGSMALLPLNAEISGQISNYLVQVDDLAKVWASAAISDELKSSQVNMADDSLEASADGTDNQDTAESGWTGFTEENYALLRELYGYSMDLSAVLSELALRVTENNHSWKNIEEEAAELLSEPFQDYPTIEYDGKYSDHMKNLTAKGLTGEKITQEQGADVVRRLFTETLSYTPTVIHTGENTLNGIDLYCYEVAFHEDDADKAYVTVTKQGGALCTMTFHTDEANGTLTAEQCQEAARAFLKALGLGKMEITDSRQEGNEMLLTFCYVQNGVYCYPDTVKVKVSGTSGEVVGYDAYLYLMSHRERSESAGNSGEGGSVPVISKVQAKAQISPKLTIEEVRECYLDNGYGGEDHFYEFRCSGLGHEFLIYIDVETGTEERIEIVE